MNRKFDNLGRINLPKEMRDKLGLGEPGSEAMIELENDKIIVTNPNHEDKFEKWIKDYVLMTESNEAEEIYRVYKEFKNRRG